MSAPAVATDPRTVRVLLADDVAEVRRLLTIGLTHTERYEVVGEAEDGRQALELAAELAPDVMILDLAMPKLDGFEVLRCLRAVAPDCRVLLLSGFAAGRFQSRALQLGACAYVEKNRGLTAITQILDEVCTDLHPAERRPTHGRSTHSAPGRPPTIDPSEELLAYVTHELTTPIAVVRGFAEALRNHGATQDDLSRTAIDAIIRNADVLRSLLDRFGQARAIEVGRLRLDLQPIELSSFVHETVTDLAGAISTHSVSIDAAVRIDVIVDPVRIRQVLTNLVSNAAKYGPHGSPIEVAVTRRGIAASITVSDRGPGIPASQHEAVFGKFTRLEHSRPGTGLGLYIARGIARAHRGDVTVHDVEGGGCRFELTFPTAAIG
ncbi:MAG TPA: ATP-binding protein [Nitriliruptorales bacterium]|nr:ATP-binding protein [Nitriliruptorales bacterium]